MRKFLLQISWLLGLSCTYLSVFSQTVEVQWVRVDSMNLLAQSSWQEELQLPSLFESATAARNYFKQLPLRLQSQGYIAASLDAFDSTDRQFKVHLYLGRQYRWKTVKGLANDRLNLNNKFIDPSLLQEQQLLAVKNWANQGYPFAKVYLDSIQIDTVGYLSATLRTEKGPLYKIDSVFNTGNVRLSNSFLQQWLDIPAGSPYNQRKLDDISRKLQELDYLQETKPHEVKMLGSGATVQTFLAQQKSSEFNGLIGFLPNNQQLASKKLLLVGEANLILRNAFGQGETLGLNWQQLQVRSPRLNLLYRHPYFLGSRFGIDLAFNLFKKDSSFINLDFQVGGRLRVEGEREFRFFILQQVSNLSVGAINAQEIISTRQLPSIGDVRVSSAGLDLNWNKTDYRYNPRKGTTIEWTGAVGRRVLHRNPDILALKDPASPAFNFATLYDSVRTNTYQFRLRTSMAKFIPLGKSTSTMKLGLQAGWVQSPQLYRNEFFQLGGFRLLRGFDEQSQYLSRYLIMTTEYRYLTGTNSYFYALLDAGWGGATLDKTKYAYGYVGTGLGMAVETKAGILNLAWAVGKRNDVIWNLRQSKIHLGLTNYF